MTINKRKKPIDDLNDIRWNHTAVLVIDECGDPSLALPETGLLAMTQQTACVLKAARARRVPVVFACDAHLKGIDHELALWGAHCLAETEDAQVSALLEPCSKDYIIHKRRYSSFFGTSLELLLDELEVNTLILCGFDTNICVLHTAADAYYRNYGIVVVGDATTSFLYGSQETGLDMMRKLYGAYITQTADLVSAMRR